MNTSDTAMLGRAVAAVGIGLGFVALWVRAVTFADTHTKYFDDGTFGGLLLILLIFAALALGGAFVTNRREYDLAYGAAGGVAFGLYLFFPAVLAFDQLDFLDAGGWLGLCSALTVIGSVVATDTPTDRPERPAPAGTGLAIAGLVLVVVGIWPKFEDGGGTYWNITGLGHSFGILLLLLAALGAISIWLAYTSQAGYDTAVWIAAVTLGATLAIPVGTAFDEFDRLGAGAWLAGIGGIVFMIGVLLMPQFTPAARSAPAPAPPPPEGSAPSPPPESN